MTAFIDKFRRVCGSRVLAWLIILNCGMFLLLWLTVMIGNSMGLPGNFTMQWLCVSSHVPSALIHPWTALTYMVTHYGFLHLLFNMLWLFWFGRIFMTTLGDRHLMMLYAGGGIMGALFYVAAEAIFPGISPYGTYLCGASASVLAVISAAAIRTPDLSLYLFLLGEVKFKWVAIGCVVLTLAGVGGGNGGGQAAHMGGLIYGVAFALLLKAGHDPARKPGFMRGRARKTQNISTIARKDVKRDGHAVAKAASGKLSDASRLDALLDKIRISGYTSLTEMERKELNALSQRLQDNSPGR